MITKSKSESDEKDKKARNMNWKSESFLQK